MRQRRIGAAVSRPRRTLFGFMLLIFFGGIFQAKNLAAQMPFYTDDSNVTDMRVLHFEIYNEFDGLQSSEYPNLNQNTANFKMNFGLPHKLEFDVDVPYLTIQRSSGQSNSSGAGDTNLGLKWQIAGMKPHSHRPGIASSFYVEFPTGNVQEELGSGLTDYWLNSIVQEPFTDTTRLTGNFGFLFAGNTSTGVLGITNTRGQVYTYGLSLVHDFNPKLSLGAEAYGGVADTSGLGRDQLQFLTGGSYGLRDGFAVTFAVLGGKFEASPTIGGQVGFAVDFPTVLHKAHPADAPAH